MNCLVTKKMKIKLHNRKIDKFLKHEQTVAKQKFLLLVLGTHESGKSTFLKQMRFIYGNGYSELETKDFIKHVHQHLFTVVQSIIKAMYWLNINYESPEAVIAAKLIRATEHQFKDLLYELYFSAIKTIWKDAGIQECFNRRREYDLSDSAGYFLTEIDRITKQDYMPSVEDILRVRVPKTGLVEYSFTVETTNIWLVDVGGLDKDRMKWLHLFDNAKAVLFIAALSDYDKNVLEANNMLQNRMKTSKTLFRKVLESPWFQNSSLILFLNKKDLFEEKIKHSHLADYYPGYEGPYNDTNAAREFIYTMYCNLNPDPEKIIYSHYTCCTDAKDIGSAFGAMHYVGVLQLYLKDYHLV